MFNHAKNSFLVKGKTKFRRPEKSFGAILARKVIDRVHHYSAVEAAVPAPRTAALPQSAFVADPAHCTLPLAALSSAHQKPSWYSTGPEQLSRNQADLALFRAAFDSQDHRLVAEKAWLGQFCDWTHQLVLRRDVPGGEQWLLALHHWGDSAALVWPCKRVAFPHHPGSFYYDVDTTLIEPQLICICQLTDWKATTFEFKSPCWQWFHMRESARVLPAAVRRVEVLPPGPLQEIAAKSGWWSLGASFINELASHLNIKVPGASSLFHTLFLMTRHILQCSEESALAYFKNRLASDDRSTAFGEELLELDEVDNILTNEDVRTFKETQANVHTKRAEVKAFRGEFKVAAEKAFKAAAKAAPKLAAKKRKKDPEWRIPLCSAVSQPEACTYCPPGGSIWVDRLNGGWCSHYPPFPRLSRSWRKYGEAECLRLVLVDLWTKHCNGTGIEIVNCPLKGILDSVPILGAIGGSSSSSSGL
jgi:hypothetical protein